RHFCVGPLAIGRSIHYKPGFHRQTPVSAAVAVPRTVRSLSVAVPRKKTWPSRRGMRRSADALKQPTYVEDKDSGELRSPHHLDLKTGMYRGRQILKPKTDA